MAQGQPTRIDFPFFANIRTQGRSNCQAPPKGEADLMKKLIVVVCAILALVGATLLFAAAKPRTVIHIITVQWKADATPAQIAKALKAAENMNYPGLKNVWTKPIKMQLPEGYKNIIVMEFESEQALKNYADSDAQKAFYEAYMPVREESRTHDVTN